MINKRVASKFRIRTNCCCFCLGNNCKRVGRVASELGIVSRSQHFSCSRAIAISGLLKLGRHFSGLVPRYLIVTVTVMWRECRTVGSSLRNCRSLRILIQFNFVSVGISGTLLQTKTFTALDIFERHDI